MIGENRGPTTEMDASWENEVTCYPQEQLRHPCLLQTPQASSSEARKDWRARCKRTVRLFRDIFSSLATCSGDSPPRSMRLMRSA